MFTHMMEGLTAVGTAPTTVMIAPCPAVFCDAIALAVTLIFRL